MIQDIILLVLVLILFGYNIYLSRRLDNHFVILNNMNEDEKLMAETLINLIKALQAENEKSEGN